MKKALALLLLLGAPVWAEPPVAVVTRVEGAVKVEEKTGNKVDVTTVHRLTRLLPGQTLRLGAGAELELAFFADGSRLRVKVTKATQGEVTDHDVVGLPGKREQPRAQGKTEVPAVNASMAAALEREPVVTASEAVPSFKLLTYGGFREGTFPVAWTIDPRAKAYTVQVTEAANDGVQVWHKSGLTETHCMVGPLNPGEYKLTVFADDPEWGKSSRDTTMAVVRVLDPDKVMRLGQLEQLAAANPDDLGLQFMLAVDYQDLGLHQDALAMADKLSRAFPDDAGVRAWCESARKPPN